MYVLLLLWQRNSNFKDYLNVLLIDVAFLKFQNSYDKLTVLSEKMLIFVAQFWKELWHIEKAHFAYSVDVNLDTSQRCKSEYVGRTLSWCVFVNAITSKWGCCSPYSIYRGVQALHQWIRMDEAPLFCMSLVSYINRTHWAEGAKVVWMAQYGQHRSHKWVTSEIVLGVFFLVCGCAIYLLFRSKTLNIYQWCSALGLSNMINSLRYSVQDWKISDFTKFSLPDGLYCAAYILIMDAIWHYDSRIVKYIVLSFVPLITISSEVFQYFGLVKGTFDIYDLVSYSIPPVIYLVMHLIK